MNNRFLKMINRFSNDIFLEINKYLTQSEKIALRKTCKVSYEVPLTTEMFFGDITMYELALWLFNKQNIINEKIKEISSYSLFKIFSKKIPLRVNLCAHINFKIYSKYIKAKDCKEKSGKYNTAKELYGKISNFKLCYQYEYKENWLLFRDILKYRIIKKSQLNVDEIFLYFIKIHCVQLSKHLSSYEICDSLYQCINVLNDETIDKLEKEFIEAFKIPAPLNLTQKPFCPIDEFTSKIRSFLNYLNLNAFALEYRENHNPLNLDIIKVNDWLKNWFFTLTLSNLKQNNILS